LTVVPDGSEAEVFRVQRLGLRGGRGVAVLPRSVAERYGISAGSIVGLGCRGSIHGGVAVVSEGLVEEGSIAVSEELWERLQGCERVKLYPLELPPSFRELHRRLQGEPLGEAGYKRLVADVVAGLYDDSQIAAFLVSQVYRPLAGDELAALIRAMVETGEVIKFPVTAHDVHSIGGVPGNSKVALIVVPTVAAAGLLIPKTSSRAITSPAGTADTMEVLARVAFKPEEILEIALKTHGVIVWGGALGLAPADDIFVRVERRLGIDPQSQMVASILAKKLAMSVTRLVVDIPFGRGAKVETEEQATELGSLFLSQAQRLGISMRIALTYGDEPIGYAVGPALEAREALETLIGKGVGAAPGLVEKACSLAGLVLGLGGAAEAEKGYEQACSILRSGKSYAKFREIIEAQEGDPDIKPEDIRLAGEQYTVTSPRDGVVTSISNSAAALAARAAGAPDDKGAGILFHVKTGYRVRRGDPLYTVYASTRGRLREALSIMEGMRGVLVEGMLVKTLP